MNPMPDSAGEETEPSPPSPPLPRRSRVILIRHNAEEPLDDVREAEAEGTWCAVSAPWHPALLDEANAIPSLEEVGMPSPVNPGEIRVVAAEQSERLPSGYATQAADLGVPLVEGGRDRGALVAKLLEIVGRSGAPPDTEAAQVADDFLALGTCHWWLRDLTLGMGHAETLEVEVFEREVLAGARAWVASDMNTARSHLRAALEMLAQCRERFYPVDAYIVDLCLVDPAMPAGVLHDPLVAKSPITFLAPALAIENQARLDPDALVKLREAVTEGWADVVGGAYAEVDEPFLPLESIVWQFRQGAEVYREHLDGRNVETVGRRRFGLYPQLPQIAKRFGFRFAIHMGFDAGRFPIRKESKRLWESPDHSALETLTRPPLAADRAATGVLLPWRMAATLRDDHVASIPLVRWPDRVAGWFRDLRRIATYSSVLARLVTLNDYFHLTDRPFETFAPGPDSYLAPYLAQAVARRDPEPITHRADHARRRAQLEAGLASRAIAEALGTAPPPSAEEVTNLERLEDELELQPSSDLDARLATLTRFWAGAVARGIVGEATGGRAGYLVINPTGIPRRAAVLLPDAAMDLRPEGPLRTAQFTEEGVWAIVELPAFGYAWVPREANFEASPAPVGNVGVRETVLHNESMTVEIDQATGGIRGIRARGEELARLGQQLAIAGLTTGAEGKPLASRMIGDTLEIDYGGPALAQVVTTGSIVGLDDRRLAGFRQRFRLWTGRPMLEIQVQLRDLDPAWSASLAEPGADPWMRYLACRWAWPDPSSMLRRTSLLAAELTEADRPETPDVLDISTRRQRTALVLGGLAHHRRHGPRMLDTLLLAGHETGREFHLGVILDLEHPHHAAMDIVAGAFVVPTDAGPPRAGPTGWLFQVDSRAIAVTRLEYVEAVEEGRGWGVALHMVETSGQPARCRLRMFRAPTWARQTDFQNESIVDLPIDGDAVLVDFTPHEIARVEVTLG